MVYARVLAWKLSITMEASFCIEALEEALSKHEKPEIFNTDHRSQFTSDDFTGLLRKNGIDISMDGKGRWRDNVFVERVWKSIKYEEVYLHAYETVQEARTSIGKYLEFYNFHESALQPRWVHARSGLLQSPARLYGSRTKQQGCAARRLMG